MTKVTDINPKIERRRIVQGHAEIQARLTALNNDISHWNRTHPDEEPIPLVTQAEIDAEIKKRTANGAPEYHNANQAMGRAIREARVAANMTLRQASATAGLPLDRYSEIERGVRRPYPGEREKIADAIPGLTLEAIELAGAEANDTDDGQ